MKMRYASILLLVVLSTGAEPAACELPRLPKNSDPCKQTYQQQKKLPDLPDSSFSRAEIIAYSGKRRLINRLISSFAARMRSTFSWSGRSNSSSRP